MTVLIVPQDLSANLEGFNIFETVVFEHFYLTRVKADIYDSTSLLLYKIIMYTIIATDKI